MHAAPAPDPEMANPRAERVKEVARLATRTGRAKRGAFLAEGPQAVREALRAHDEAVAAGRQPVVLEVYATPEALERHRELATGSGRIHWRSVSPEVLAAMADTVTPQGIIAVCHIPETTLESVFAGAPRLVAVLCRVQDPGNAGTILRAADAAGADAIVVSGGSVDIYNPKAVRSTVGSVFHLPIVTGATMEQVAAAARAADAQVLAADGYGTVDLDALQDESAARRAARSPATPGATSAEPGTAVVPGGSPRLEEPTVWLFGNEAQGLADAELALAGHRVAVPLYGIAESLNVGTAATVCLYASARAQRRSP